MEEEWDHDPQAEEGNLKNETFIFEEPSSSGTFADFGDEEKTPANTSLIRAQHEARERRIGFEMDVTRYLAKMPDELSLPGSVLLAKESREEIQKYEDMYQHLDTGLKDILRRYDPGIKIPSFHDLLAADPRTAAVLASDMHREVKQSFYHQLSLRTFREVIGLLDLFASFAENIANAKYMREHPDA